jgi:hypothetical protein
MPAFTYYGAVIDAIMPGLYVFFGVLFGGKLLLWALRQMGRFRG